MHWIYVLVLPIMIFNYIIGVVSAQLSSMVEAREEKTILHRINVSLLSFMNTKKSAKSSIVSKSAHQHLLI